MPSSVPALLALEIRRVLDDLELRRDLLVELWSMHRDRWPMFEAAFSRWKTLRSRELDALEPEVVVVVDDFYAALEDFVQWAGQTEEMPLHLDWSWRQHMQRLEVAGRRALELLGPPPAVEIPEEDADGRTFLEGFVVRKKVRSRPASRPAEE